MKLSKQLLLSGLGLLALPWLGYQYLTDLRNFLIEGQERAQLLAAQAVATSLQNRNDLFESRQSFPQSFEENALYVHPLDYYIQIDGYKSDWEEFADEPRHFSANNIIKSETDYSADEFSFELVIGQRESYLYVLLQVTDSTLVYRHPRYHRLDNSDHIRIAAIDDQAKIHRYILTTEGIGFISAYEVGQYWRYPITGKPVPGLLGYWRKSSQGYDLEFRMPLALIGSLGRFDLAVANVEDAKKRQVKTLIGTLPAKWSKELNRIVFRAPELERIIRNLKRSGTNIWVVDRYSRVRAHVADRLQFSRDAQKRTELAIQKALKGQPATQRFRQGKSPEKEIIMAAFPIRSDQGVLGAVVVELPTDEILSLQRETLEKSAIYTAMIILTIVAGLVLFSSRLTIRIQRLRREVSEVVDAHGRVQSDGFTGYPKSKDEIGDLSRSIASVLGRLQRYTRFLERMPKTLKHEINNPLNTISTSIQNLANLNASSNQQTYIESAERGVAKLTNIVQSLAEAASLEDALRLEDFQSIDLPAMLSAYVENCRRFYPNHRFELNGIDSTAYVEGDSFRLEQCLDKLIDNAVELSPENSTIIFDLCTYDQSVSISVANEGPRLPENLPQPLFDSMVSYRRTHLNSGSSHMGIGLYVARTIAESHGARVTAENRRDCEGVRITVGFPRLGEPDKIPSV